MATPRMPSLIPRRPGLVHYAFAAVVGWATSYYTFQPLLEQQVSCWLAIGQATHWFQTLPADIVGFVVWVTRRPANGQQDDGGTHRQTL